MTAVQPAGPLLPNIARVSSIKIVCYGVEEYAYVSYSTCRTNYRRCTYAPRLAISCC